MPVAMDPIGEAETLYPDTGNRDDPSTDPCATDTLGHLGADALSVDDEGGDIRVEYHPNSSRRCKTFTFEGFEEASSKARSTCPADPEPWAPFNTREDFEFAALVREAGMSKQLVEKLITLFQRCIDKGKESFTLSKYDDMRETMMLASEQLPKVFYSLCYTATNPLTNCPSLKRKPSLYHTRTSHKNSMFGCGQSGHGLKLCCRTKISSNTLSGMLAVCQSLTKNQTLGYGSMMSHGQETNFGKLK